MSKYIGIYGGAFDPPHKSHIETAKALIKERGYDRLILLPSHNPPHKQLSAKDEDRLNMLNFFSGDKIAVSTVEIDRHGIGYTVDYLPELFLHYGFNIEYIIGGDSFLNFDKWYKPLEILKQVKILVVARDNDRDILFKKLNDYKDVQKKGIEIAKYMPKSMSSSEIRNLMRLGYEATEFLSEKVVGYIKNNNLYNEYADFLSKLKENLSEERFEHTRQVVLYALKINEKLKLDYNKVFLACLLHDCAKYNLNYAEIAEKNSLLPKDCVNSLVAHAFCGKIIAKQDYNICDEEILNAIYYHTTARPNMTTLDKLVYCADMLEPSRDFDGVQKLRDAFENDFEKGFVMCLESTVNNLKERNIDIYPLTLEAYNFYKRS